MNTNDISNHNQPKLHNKTQSLFCECESNECINPLAITMDEYLAIKETYCDGNVYILRPECKAGPGDVEIERTDKYVVITEIG